jgi:hypothetical protein
MKKTIEERNQILNDAFVNDTIVQVHMHHQKENDAYSESEWEGHHTIDLYLESGRIIRFFNPTRSQFVVGIDNNNEKTEY